jgi:hypothetical protein
MDGNLFYSLKMMSNTVTINANYKQINIHKRRNDLEAKQSSVIQKK